MIFYRNSWVIPLPFILDSSKCFCNQIQLLLFHFPLFKVAFHLFYLTQLNFVLLLHVLFLFKTQEISDVLLLFLFLLCNKSLIRQFCQPKLIQFIGIPSPCLTVQIRAQPIPSLCLSMGSHNIILRIVKLNRLFLFPGLYKFRRTNSSKLLIKAGRIQFTGNDLIPHFIYIDQSSADTLEAGCLIWSQLLLLPFLMFLFTIKETEPCGIFTG